MTASRRSVKQTAIKLSCVTVLCGALIAASSSASADDTAITSLNDNVQRTELEASVATGNANELTSDGLSEAKAEAERLMPMGTALDEVVEAYPNDFAYSRIIDGEYLVAFANQAPTQARSILNRPGMSFQLVENVGYSSIDLRDDVSSVHDQVLALTEGRQSFDIGADPARNRISVTLGGSGAESSARAFTPDFSEIETISGLPLAIESSVSEPSVTGYGRHGGTRTLTSQGANHCTGGFVAKSNASADLGLLSAGHCTQAYQYYNQETGERQRLYKRNDTYGASGDAAFLASPVMMDAWFLVAPQSGRPVLEVRDAHADELICRYGAATREELCGTVSLLETSYFDDQTGVSVKRQTSAKMWANFGDSGGPVYGGNTAMGILSGTSKVNGVPDKSFNRRIWFTPIRHVEAITNTRVCLEPVCR